MMGDEAHAQLEHAFSLRDALADDLWWICKHAEAVALIPGWGNSAGATAELYAARALNLRVIELERWAL